MSLPRLPPSLEVDTTASWTLGLSFRSQVGRLLGAQHCLHCGHIVEQRILESTSRAKPPQAPFFSRQRTTSLTPSAAAVCCVWHLRQTRPRLHLQICDVSGIVAGGPSSSTLVRHPNSYSTAWMRRARPRGRPSFSRLAAEFRRKRALFYRNPARKRPIVSGQIAYARSLEWQLSLKHRLEF